MKTILSFITATSLVTVGVLFSPMTYVILAAVVLLPDYGYSTLANWIFYMALSTYGLIIGAITHQLNRLRR
jgi:hypothetical protein